MTSLKKGGETLADGTIKILTEIVTTGIEKGLKITAKMITSSAKSLADLGAAAIQVGSSFEASMSQVAATMGITKETIDENGVKPFEVLSQAAKDAGATTKYSATEAAEGLNYLALAGYDAQTAADTLPAVLNLAAAGGLELAYASDLATDAMAALGIEASSANLTQFGDKMAKTASKANTSVGQLGEAILTVGGTAKSLAGGTTELNAALGVLANRGIKGAEGGTALRNVILSLTAPTDKAASALKALGVEVNDAEGNMRPLNDVFTDLNASLADMSESERTQVLNEIFNKVDLKSAQALLAGCGDEFDNLALAIDDSDGAMQQMADTMNDNLNGQITILKSGLEGLGIEVYESVQEPLKNLAKEAQALVSEMTAAFKSGGFEGLAESIGSVLSTIVNKIVAATPKLVDAAAQLVNGLITGITQNASSVAKEAAAVVTNFVTGVTSLLPQLLTTGVKLLSELVKGVSKQIPTLMQTAVTIVTQLVTALVKAIPQLANAGVSLVKGLLSGVTKALPTLFATFPKAVTQLVTALIKAIPQLVNAGVSLVKGLLSGITKALPTLLAAIPALIKGILSALTQAIPQIAAAGVELLSSVVKDLPQIIAAIVQAIPQIISGIISGLAQLAPAIVTAGVELFGGLIKAIPTIIVELLKAIPQIIVAIVEGLLGGIASIFEAAIKLFSPVQEQAGVTVEQMEAAGERVGTFAQALQEATPAAADFSNAVSATGNTMSDLDSKISDCESKITATLQAAYSEQSGLRDQDLEDVKEYTEKWQQLQLEKLGIYKDGQAQILAEAKATATTLTVEQYAEMAAKAESAQSSALSQLSEAKSAEQKILYDAHKAAGTLNTDAYAQDLAALNKKYADEETAIKAATNEIYQTLIEAGQKQADATQATWDSIGQKAQEGVAKTGNIFSVFATTAGDLGELATSEFAAGISGIPDEGSGAMLGLAAEIKANGGAVEGAAASAAQRALEPFEGLSKETEEAGKNTLLGMIEGIEGLESALGDTSEMSAQQVVDAIKSYLGIASPSRVLMEIGQNVIQGLTQGIQGAQNQPANAMTQVGASILSALQGGGLDATSLSKYGATAVSGLAAGVKSTQNTVTSAVTAIGIAATTTLQKDTMSSGIMSGIGKAAISSLASGAKGAQSSVTSTMKTIGTQSQSAIKTGGLNNSTMSGIGSSAVKSVSSGASSVKGTITSAMQKIGSAAASGMKAGMNSQLSSLLSAARSIASKVTAAFKAKLDIHSPSRVMAREVGAPIAQGIGLGFNKSIGSVVRDMERSVEAESFKLPVGATAIQRGIIGYTPNTTPVGNTYNITNNVQSPVPTTVAQSAREANRMTEDTLFKLGVYGI